MIINSFNGKSPRISPEAFVAPNATIIGDVTIKKGANIWYGAVLRADVCSIIIGENTSIQDNCVIHSEIGTTFEIKDHCIVGHHAMLHGPSIIERGTMVGIHATVLMDSLIGEGSVIAAGAVARKQIEPHSMIVGVPGKLKRLLGPETMEATIANAEFYRKNGENFRKAGLGHDINEANRYQIA